MSVWDWLDSDRRGWAIGTGCVSLFMLYWTVRTGNYTDLGSLHPMLVLGVLSSLLSLGLFLQQEWSRWLGIGLGLGMVCLAVSQMYFSGISLERIGLILCAGYVIHSFPKLPITAVQEVMAAPEFNNPNSPAAREIRRRLDNFKPWSITLVYNSVVEINAHQLATAAHQAFGQVFTSRAEAIDPVDASFIPSDHPEPIAAGEIPVLVCWSPPYLIGVFVATSEIGNPTQKRVPFDFQEEVASVGSFIQLDLMPYLNNDEPIRNGYSINGKLAAELVDADCVGVYFPDHDLSCSAFPELSELLRLEDPCTAIENWRLRN